MMLFSVALDPEHFFVSGVKKRGLGAMVSPLDLLEYREEAERTRKDLAECSVALEDIKSLGENRVPDNFPSIRFQRVILALVCMSYVLTASEAAIAY